MTTPTSNSADLKSILRTEDRHDIANWRKMSTFGNEQKLVEANLDKNKKRLVKLSGEHRRSEDMTLWKIKGRMKRDVQVLQDIFKSSAGVGGFEL